MFVLIQELEEVTFRAEDLVKVNRGMNMVKVSVGEHQSEPAEVYVATARDGENLSTYIVFYLTGPGVRALYGFDGNPYPPPRRIDVETEALEFVEEMGAILEDIGWDSMSGDERKAWLDQQFLLPSEDDIPGVNSEMEEVEEYEELEEVQTLEPLPAGPDEAKGERIESVPEEKAAPDDEAEEKPGEGEGEVKKSIGRGEGKIVFAEEQFDEMLKKAFISPLEDAAPDEDSSVEILSDELSAEDVSPGEPDPVKLTEPPDSEATAALAEAGSAAGEEVKAGDEEEKSPAVEGLSDEEKILRFLSKI